MNFFKDSKMVLHIALPLLSSRLLNLLVFFAGFVMIAKLGPEKFAASSLGSSAFVTVIMIAVGILYAIGIKISYAFGAKNNEKIREYYYGGILLAIILSILTVIVMLLISLLIPYLGQKAELVPLAKEFIYTLCLPVLPSLLSVVINQLVTGLLKPRIIFLASLIDVPITIAILYLLIFGKFGFPPLGVWGLGIGLFIGNIILFIIPIIYIIVTPYFKQFKLGTVPKFGKTLWIRLKEMIQLGFPMGVQFGAEIGSFSVITFLIGRYGVNALNAAQISNQIIVVTSMIPFTLSEAAAILVGRSLGKKDPVAIRNYGISSCSLTILCCAIMGIIIILFPKLFISIYLNIHDPKLADIVHLSVLFLYISSVSLMFDGVRNVATGALRGLHDSKYPMYIGVIVTWLISLPLGSVLAFLLKLGPLGFPLGSLVAFLTGSIILIIRFNQMSRYVIN